METFRLFYYYTSAECSDDGFIAIIQSSFYYSLHTGLNNYFLFLFQERQFQDQQEELRKEIQQRSTQQLLEQSSYYDNNSKADYNSFDYYTTAAGAAAARHEKPQLITNLNNLNYQSSSNYNTINHSSAKDILYELKQYERFANNHLDNHPQYDHLHQQQQHVRSYSSGSNYSQNILNYNNSYYKINNINNYNYIKTSKSPTTYRSTDDVNIDNKKWATGDNNCRMEHTEDIRAVERSHLVKEREANGHNVTIHNFSGNNHTTVHVPSTTIVDDEEQDFQHHQQQQQNHNKHSGNPFQQSHHLTQVSLNFCRGMEFKVFFQKLV